MQSPEQSLVEYGVVPTEFPEVNRQIVPIVTDPATRFTPDTSRTHLLGRNLYTGTNMYQQGAAPFDQRVMIGQNGLVQQLAVSRPGVYDLPDGYREKAHTLTADQYGIQPSDAFPEVTGWQLQMLWAIGNRGLHRMSRLDALYPGPHLVDTFDTMQRDPLVIISPVVVSGYSANTPPVATEMIGMFGRYNRGDIVPAAVNFDEHPYMQRRSFENKQLMQTIVNDFLFDGTR
jgi:hypothetical protein